MHPLPFSDRDRIESGAIYVASIGALMTFMTWIESEHSLARGLFAGVIGGVIVVAVGLLARRAR